MKSFVFTAGLGTRLYPITNFMPKPAIPLLNISIVYYALTPLFKANVKDLICNLHHLPDKMSKTLNTLEDKSSIKLIKEHPNLLGSAGGIQNAKYYFQNEGHFFYCQWGYSFSTGRSPIFKPSFKTTQTI